MNIILIVLIIATAITIMSIAGNIADIFKAKYGNKEKSDMEENNDRL